MSARAVFSFFAQEVKISVDFSEKKRYKVGYPCGGVAQLARAAES